MVVIKISYEQDHEFSILIKQIEKVSKIKKLKCKKDCSKEYNKAYVSIELKDDVWYYIHKQSNSIISTLWDEYFIVSPHGSRYIIRAWEHDIE